MTIKAILNYPYFLIHTYHSLIYPILFTIKFSYKQHIRPKIDYYNIEKLI